jgi:hypothetical protein
MGNSKTLETAFSAAIGKAMGPEMILTGLITRRLTEMGITLSAGNVAILKRRLKSRGKGELSIEIDDEGFPGLTSDEVREKVQAVVNGLGPTVAKLCDRVMKAVPGLLDDLVTSLADRKAREIKRGKLIALRDNRRVKDGFREHVQAQWAIGLDALEVQIGVITEINLRYVAQSNERNERSGRRIRQVLMSLHARACQIAQEILMLLTNGYADGAHARWRSLHEVGTVACFIVAHGERTAYRYVMHEVVESLKSAQEQLETWSFLLAFMRQLKLLERQCARLVTKYGKQFGKPYGWAAHCFGGRRTTFRDIEKVAQLEMIRPHYGLANNNVHAGAKGAAFRLGIGLTKDRVLLVGPSDRGLEDPGVLAAYSLMQATVTLLTYRPDIERLALARLVMKLTEEATSGFQHAAG